MTVFQKIALSLLLSLVLCAGVAALAYTGLFDLVEARFYNPSITRALLREAEKDAAAVEEFLSGLQNRFMSSLNEAPVRRSFLPARSAADTYERSRVYGRLTESVAGLHSVRFVDSEGRRVFFSTNPLDLAGQDEFSSTYRDYGDDPFSLPFGSLRSSGRGDSRIIPDIVHDRIIFSFPFFDSRDVFRGTALFSVSTRAVTERLIGEGRLRAGEDVSLTASPPGIVSGVPGLYRGEILFRAAAVWNGPFTSFAPLASAGAEPPFALVSAMAGPNLFYGRLIAEDVFVFPSSMKALLLAAVFLTIYLTVFFFFNLKQDPLTIIQNRLERLQRSLIAEFHEHRGDIDRDYWSRELEQRREEIHAELKRGITAGQGGISGGAIDSLIDGAWDELLSFISSDGKAGPVIGGERLRRTLSHAPDSPTPPAEREEADEALEELEVVTEPDEAAGETPPVEAVKFRGGLLAAAARKQGRPARKKTNVRLAFGDDDIPYIVESSGVELVEDDIDEAIRSMQEDNFAGPEDLEYLEAVNEGESGPALPSPGDIDDLASRIEFSPAAAEPEDETLGAALEIVSPFASILSPLDNAGGRQPETAEPEAAELEELSREAASSGGTASVVYRPFHAPANHEPELLEAAEDVIIEQDGISYINDSALHGNSEEKLDSRFRELVESVIVPHGISNRFPARDGRAAF